MNATNVFHAKSVTGDDLSAACCQNAMRRLQLVFFFFFLKVKKKVRVGNFRKKDLTRSGNRKHRYFFIWPYHLILYYGIGLLFHDS